MVTIEEYTQTYQRAVIDLILPIQREEFGVAVTLEDQPDLLDIPGFYQQRAGNFWLALAAGQVVGSVALLDIGAGQAALRKMFVRADQRGREHGIARQLLERLLAWAAKQGLREIYLGTTVKYLAAHRFYEKSGFREIVRGELPSSFPIMTVDTKFYARDVMAGG